MKKEYFLTDAGCNGTVHVQFSLHITKLPILKQHEGYLGRPFSWNRVQMTRMTPGAQPLQTCAPHHVGGKFALTYMFKCNGPIHDGSFSGIEFRACTHCPEADS
ncbi:hypothetical protein AVEN_41710-1 [Araneus ventricosus]|uniref:Uncharacterized protein n=1 Tax=Araneus ventricosus TaxID=182803 RepID=A0A4Y2AC32_ARAVE|nr:hypothetical protein AVEN_41710-1 [Araneus ventricosus]